MPRVPAHIATTRHLSVAYPLATEAGLGHQGVLIGQDVLGGSFVYDPFVLYRQGVITNPNMVVFGQIGRGKSSFVKSYLWRQAVFGRRAWVVDPKGEYGPLARAWGVAPVALRPGGSVRLNPLDTGELNDGAGPGNDRQPDGAGAGGGTGGDEAWRRRVELTASLAVACLGRHLVPRERAAIDAALTEATERSRTAQMPAPTLPDVVESLLDPSANAARQLRTDQPTLMEDGRDVALELRRLVYGDLRGMFDGPTTPGLRLDAPLVVLDLSAVYNSPALGVLMACATAWLQNAVQAEHRHRVIVVVDEAWAILSKASIQHGPMAGRRITVGVGLRGSCRPRRHVRDGSSLLSRRLAPERVQLAAPTAPATKRGPMGFAVGASGLRACSCWGTRVTTHVGRWSPNFTEYSVKTGPRRWLFLACGFARPSQSAINHPSTLRRPLVGQLDLPRRA
jgi:hypothetical protein